MKKVNCFIRKNTPELRKRIKDLGVEVCCCASFKSSIYLDYDYNITHMVHGAPLYDEFNDEQNMACFLADVKNSGHIDCGKNEELFLALIALRDDTDKYQWFVADNPTVIEDYAKWFKCPYDDINEIKFSAYINEGYTYHKATVEEIIKHFKTK